MIMYLGNIHKICHWLQSLLETFFSYHPKMALFGLNWEESKWPGHFSSTFLNFFASKICVKLPPEKKVPWHWCWALLSSRWNSHFSKKNAFFGQKKAFFQKVHFIQICSVTQNKVFQYVKNIFLLSKKKLIFFTEFNLIIMIAAPRWSCSRRGTSWSTWRRGSSSRRRTSRPWTSRR